MVFQSPIMRAYPAYKSPFGPKYHYQPNFAGITTKHVMNFGMTAGAFGGVALFGVIYFASGIPRVQKDVLNHVPFLAKYFDNSVPASDNPF